MMCERVQSDGRSFKVALERSRRRTRDRLQLLISFIFMGIWLGGREASAAQAPPPATSRIIPKVAVIAIGDCEADRELVELARDVRDRLGAEVGIRLVTEEALGRATASFEDVQKAIEEAREAMKRSENGVADEILTRAMLEVDRLPIGAQRWSAYWSVRAIAAWNAQKMGQESKALDHLIQVLRTMESFKLTRLYPPSERQLLEQARAKVRKQPHVQLDITSEKPGEQVFLNSAPAGSTPLSLSMAQGENLEIVLGDAGSHTLPRRIELSSDTAVHLDVQAESKVRPDSACYAGSEDGGGYAAQLVGRASGADQVALIGRSRGTITARLYETSSGREIRRGVLSRSPRAAESPATLARFILTGEGLGATLAFPSESKTMPALRWKPVAAWALVGLAVGLGAVSLIQGMRAARFQNELERYQNSPVTSSTFASAKETLDNLHFARNVSIVCGIGAGVAAVGSVTLFVINVSATKSATHGNTAQPTVTFAIGGTF